MISIFTINTKINFCILHFSVFYVLENEMKVCSKFCKKIIIIIWSLYVTISKINENFEFYSDFRLYLVLNFFIHQIRSFCMISIFTTNTKINFCILLFNEFYDFRK